MPFQFGKPKDKSDPQAPRPVPNYFSRRVQLRIFTLVAMVMLALWLMDQARKPQNWSWMWGGKPNYAGGPPLTDAELAGRDQDVDTRLHPATEGKVAPDESKDHVGAATQESEDSRLDRTRVDGWSRMTARLSVDDDERLRKALKAARDGKLPDPDVQRGWSTVVPQLETGWDGYLQEAFQYLIDARDQLSEPQRAAWHAAVRRLEIEWRQSFQPALAAAGSGEVISPEHREALADLQAILDRAALGTVRDNSVFRSTERHAWFRLLEKLDDAGQEELERDSGGRVGFIQLFDQPDEYRGKLVTVRGSAHLAYRVRAPKNSYGIEHYYVFWLAPAGGPESPMCVYALNMPPGFPAIKDKDLDRETTPLDVEMEFTGYFFKRWAYRAEDGLRLAPLVLAKTPRWTAPVAAVAPPAPLGPAAIAVYVAAIAILGIGIALVAWRQGRARSISRRAYDASPERYRRQLKALEENDPAVDIHETLRRLSKEQTN